MRTEKLRGLIAAAYTPLANDGSLSLAAVSGLVEHLISSGASGLYVCGSTGEGMSLTTEERQAVAAEFVHCVAGRVPVIVQVGHNCLAEAATLAAHAAAIGADVVSATCPSYFKISSVPSLVQSIKVIADASARLPFYYYHIPALTGSAIDIVEFMTEAPAAIENLVGLKYTDTQLHTYLECTQVRGGQLDIVWGCDEMLLGAIATGATAAIGSTYNIAAPLYSRLWDAFADGDIVKARELQLLSVQMIRIMNNYPFHAAMKAVLFMQGIDVGGCRLPQGKLTDAQCAELRDKLNAIGFFRWSRYDSPGEA